jgi:FAD synthetase
LVIPRVLGFGDDGVRPLLDPGFNEKHRFLFACHETTSYVTHEIEDMNATSSSKHSRIQVITEKSTRECFFPKQRIRDAFSPQIFIQRPVVALVLSLFFLGNGPAETRVVAAISNWQKTGYTLSLQSSAALLARSAFVHLGSYRRSTPLLTSCTAQHLSMSVNSPADVGVSTSCADYTDVDPSHSHNIKENLRPSALDDDNAFRDSDYLTNWRVIQLPRVKDVPYLQDDQDVNLINTFDAKQILLEARPLWSKSQYEDALNLYHKLTTCTDDYVKSPLERALRVLHQAYRLYGPESVICSFNGGKDAVVILHLVCAAHAHYYNTTNVDNSCMNLPVIRPRTVYWENPDEFPDVTQFLHTTVRNYDLDMLVFRRDVKFAPGLQVLVDYNYGSLHDVALGAEEHQPSFHPFPLAFVLGTRANDPNADGQQSFSPSSHYMPPFMRVNPIIEWTYGHVWHFLRLFQLPYCRLYDLGYTSLGTVNDTRPCPALAVAGAMVGASNNCTMSVPKFWPAYMLRDWSQERAGRIPKDVSRILPVAVQASKVEAHATDDNSVESIQDDSSTANLSTMSELPPLNRKAHDVASREAMEHDLEDLSAVSYRSPETPRTVGLLIIGDEILKGFTADTNTQTAAKSLRDNQVLLDQVSVVPDNQDRIVQELRRLDQQVDVIITSGGVGPTHDDVTIKSVAVFLNSDLVLHDEMVLLLREKMKTSDDEPLSEAQTKMATIPKASKLRHLSNNPNDWPVLQCRNVFILPGVPEYFAAKITNVASYLSCQLQRRTSYKVVLSVDETSIVSILNKAVANHPNVVIGSYPYVSQPDYQTILTVEGRLLSHSIADTEDDDDDVDDVDSGNREFVPIASRGQRSNSNVYSCSRVQMSSRNQMDRYVENALDELIRELPNGSILRVENNERGVFDE